MSLKLKVMRDQFVSAASVRKQAIIKIACMRRPITEDSVDKKVQSLLLEVT